MKTIFTKTGLAAMLAVAFAGGAFGQTPTPDPVCAEAANDTNYAVFGEKIKEYNAALKDYNAKSKITTADGRRAASDASRTVVSAGKAALDPGKAFLTKYNKCTDQQATLDYLNKAIPTVEKKVAEIEKSEERKGFEDKFFNGLNAKNWDDVYAAGRSLLSLDPETYRSAELVLGSVGFDETQKKNYKYNDETIRYAKASLADLEGGKTFNVWGHGIYDYSIADPATKKADPAKSRENAIGWMNYNIGYILALDPSKNSNKKESAGYLYKASKSSGGTGKVPAVYRAIAQYYIEESNKRLAEAKTAFEALKALDSQTGVDQATKDAAIAKYENAQGLYNANTELAFDAVARAYNLAKASTKPEDKAFANDQYTLLKDLHNNRFGNTTGVDALIAKTTASPLPDPAAPVQPKIDPKPGSTTGGTATVTPAPAATTPPATTVTKPAAPAAKPVAPATKPAAVTKPGTGSAVKPAVKKPGTR